ncbi:hypothetical protein B0H34DRAFT_469841 [Crassisporium funariophilum]|nr:hypothetical protein B0H34DRAFT_469841 [Crassisporium funariophilum]
MPAKDKDRLYLTLNHRHELPGYHWSILLAPKDVKDETEAVPSRDRIKESMQWDVTNDDDKENPWRFRQHPINQYLSISLCARILLRKFNSEDREQTISIINELLETIDVPQNDPTFTCRVWVLNSIQALKDRGLINLSLPQDELEARVKAFGDQAMHRILTREVDIAAEGVSSIPVLDLRK